jgi:hypothetical protein
MAVSGGFFFFLPPRLFTPFPAAPLALRFSGNHPANIPELPWPLQEALLPLLAFFGGCRLITKCVDLLVSQIASLGHSVWASLFQWLRSRGFLELISNVRLKLTK